MLNVKNSNERDLFCSALFAMCNSSTLSRLNVDSFTKKTIFHKTLFKFFDKLKSWKHSLKKKERVAEISIDKCLIGDQGGLTAFELSLLTGDWSLPSTLVVNSPHAELIRLYHSYGESVFDIDCFVQTSYYKFAFNVMSITGHWFGAKNTEAIREVAIDFINRYLGKKQSIPKRPGQSGHGSLIIVRPVQYSSYFQVVDGHHRLAILANKGVKTVKVHILDEYVLTPIQCLLLNVAWIKGKKEIYQPLPFPECQESWTLIRRCTDRFEAMLQFLEKKKITSGTYLDVGSYFGWFVAQMLLKGFDSYGIELDPVAVVVGNLAYNLDFSRITVGNCYFVLRNLPRRFDIVSCLSVLHHFVLGKGVCSAQELIKLLDKKTKKVLFLEMGQATENWFKYSLKDWTPDYIENWVLENTTFRNVERIHVDNDNRPPYEGNYGRTLFAFYR